jgi:hypothetical protein
MVAIPLKGQYGPTLGRLLAPRWHAAPRLARGLVIAAGVIVLALLIGAGLTLENAHYSQGGAVPFSFSYRDLSRSAPEPGGYVRVERRVDGRLVSSFAVGPLVLPPYSGGVNSELALYASSYVEALRRRDRGFTLSGEGKTRVNTVPAYTVFYTTQIRGRTYYGRDVLLTPERAHPRRGVRIVMLSLPHSESGVDSPMELATGGVLELPLESFTLG